MRARLGLLVGLVTMTATLVHCVGDEPAAATSSDGGDLGDAGGSDTFVPPGDSGGPSDAGGDAATACSAAASNVTCGAGVNPCIIQVAGGGGTFCARDTNCHLYCWGDNTEGELAVDPATKAFSATPVPIDLGSQFVVGVDVGGEVVNPNPTVVCARVTSVLGAKATLACWGSDRFGQLGVLDAGPLTDPDGGPFRPTPMPVPGLNDIALVAAGSRHVCAASSVGLIDCWGDNANGQLGRATTGNVDPTPGPLSMSIKPLNAASVGIGFEHTCFLSDGKQVICTGRNEVDQLGNTGASGTNAAPVFNTVTTGGTPLALTVGGNTNCALDSTGVFHCWGSNQHGQVGNGTETNAEPAPISPTGLAAVSAGGGQAGFRHFCANLGATTLPDAGFAPNIVCWGDNDQGQITEPTDGGDLPTPTPVSNLPNGKIVKMSATTQATCALYSDGTVWCWGYNLRGQLGTNVNGGNDLTAQPPAHVVF